MRDLKARARAVPVTSPPYYGPARMAMTRENFDASAPQRVCGRAVERCSRESRPAGRRRSAIFNLGTDTRVIGATRRPPMRAPSPKANPEVMTSTLDRALLPRLGAQASPKDMLEYPGAGFLRFRTRAGTCGRRSSGIKPTLAAEGRASASRFTRAASRFSCWTKKYRYKFGDNRRLRSVWGH